MFLQVLLHMHGSSQSSIPFSHLFALPITVLLWLLYFKAIPILMLTVARASEEGKKSRCKTLCMFIDRSVYGRIGNKNCSNLISLCIVFAYV
jgi:hypothetical protein